MRGWGRTRRGGREWAPEGMTPPNGYSMLPWLLMGMGAVSHLFQGKSSNPWLTGLGLLVFNSLYIAVVFRAFSGPKRDAPTTWWLLAGMAAVTLGLSIAYGGPYLLYFPLLGLAAGSVTRGRRLPRVVFPLCVTAAVVAGVRDGWGAINVAYGTFISAMVTAAIFALSETVRELRATRQELARAAVEKERLRFSRDLHDLLGHTLSVIVVKSEAARRLAPRDVEAALAQVADIESVGRQALAEIREAVTGYREGNLATELDGARDALSSAGIDPVVRQSGPPLPPATEALLCWVVRESVTNAVRHSEATRCTIDLGGTLTHVRLTITDNGKGTAAPPGTGLKGLHERITTAGGSLTTGPTPQGGFRVTAELPVGVVTR
ncbi:sensor histidine kinase [Streptomyces sp. NPDC001927]